MTASIQHGGVIRAALSLENPEPGEPEVVQLLTSGKHPAQLSFVHSGIACMVSPASVHFTY